MGNPDSSKSDAGVSRVAKQASEIRARWAWTEAHVWTDPMLSALDTGVKGGVWFKGPNPYFAKLGLFSLEDAWVEARQSFRCNH